LARFAARTRHQNAPASPADGKKIETSGNPKYHDSGLGSRTSPVTVVAAATIATAGTSVRATRYRRRFTSAHAEQM
jgi:hypothetical protein